MRLPPRAGRAGEVRGLAQHLGRARDRETRRDGITEPAVVDAVPALDQVGRFAHRSLEDRPRLDRRVVGVAIHHHLAEDRADAVGFGRAERSVHRGFVDDTVGQNGRRPGGSEGLEDRGRQPFGDSRIGPRAFGREGDPVQPGQQVECEAQTRIRQLGQVRMRSTIPGSSDPRPQVDGTCDQLGWRSPAAPTDAIRPVSSTTSSPSGS